MTDWWFFGGFTHLALETPSVEIFQDNCVLFSEGGARNVRECLKAWSAESCVDGTVRTPTIKKRWVVDDKIIFRHDTNMNVLPWDNKVIPISHDKVLIADYGRGLIDPEKLSCLKDENVIFSPHLVNCKKPLDFPNWTFVMNEVEFKTLRDHNGDSWGTFKILVVTRSNHITIYSRGEEISYTCFNPLQPKHTVGIGDCFLSAFAVSQFVDEKPIRESVQYAYEVCKKVLTRNSPITHRVQEDDV